MAALLVGGAEPFVQFWQRISRETILQNYFEFGLVVQEEMPFSDFSYLELCQPFCSAEQNHLCTFGRGCYEKQFCEFISNLDQWFRRRCRLKYFLSGALVSLVVSGAEPFMQF